MIQPRKEEAERIDRKRKKEAERAERIYREQAEMRCQELELERRRLDIEVRKAPDNLARKLRLWKHGDIIRCRN